MLHNLKNDRIGIFAALLLGATALTACGSESTAADDVELSDDGVTDSPEQANDTATSAAANNALPIEKGIYGDTETGNCANTKRAFFYDGANYGYIIPAIPGWQDVAYSESNRIVRVGPPAKDSEFYEDYRGYTLVWHTGNANDDEDVLGIKAGQNGRFETTAVSTGPKGYMYSNETYQKCALAQMSSYMQAAIRAEVPQLAGGAAPAAAKSSVAFPPIPQGFYAYGSTCAEAIASGAGGDPPIGLVLFTAKGIGEWDGTMQISGFEDLGKGRFRVKGRSFGNGDDPVGEQSDFTIRITGPASFFDEGMQAEHTHCPNVPANVREQYM